MEKKKLLFKPKKAEERALKTIYFHRGDPWLINGTITQVDSIALRRCGRTGMSLEVVLQGE